MIKRGHFVAKVSNPTESIGVVLNTWTNSEGELRVQTVSSSGASYVWNGRELIIGPALVPSPAMVNAVRERLDLDLETLRVVRRRIAWANKFLAEHS